FMYNQMEREGRSGRERRERKYLSAMGGPVLKRDGAVVESFGKGEGEQENFPSV
ncbi:hypothetical protein U1Q18_042177, partial [Sarracenia purpurea var. burkii]